MEAYIVNSVEYKFYEELIIWCINEDDTELIMGMRYHFN